MLSPNEQKMQVCMLKTNLEDIANHVVNQSEVLVSNSEEIQQLNQTVDDAARQYGDLMKETDRLKAENVLLTAKRLNKMREFNTIKTSFEKAKKQHDEGVQQINKEWLEICKMVESYEKRLRELIEKFKDTPPLEKIKDDIENQSKVLQQLLEKEAEAQKRIEDLQKEFDSMVPSVPEDILNILGQQELQNKIKSLNEDMKL